MNFSAGISSVCPSIYRSSLFLGRPTPQTPGPYAGYNLWVAIPIYSTERLGRIWVPEYDRRGVVASLGGWGTKSIAGALQGRWGHRPSRWKSAKKRYVSELCSPFTRVLQRRADLPRCRTSKKPLTPFRYKTRAEPAWVSFEPLSTKGKSTLCMASPCPSSPQPFDVM
ncbi:hypothetical protein BJ912DRAFT_175660 [Pholiota molesta]|nr:hypothetical protein BJ912DRAFT_175660 [Pholiota molesta]